MVQFQVFDLQTVARIVGAPKAATGLSEAREAAGAIAELRIACFLRSKKPPEFLKFKIESEPKSFFLR